MFLPWEKPSWWKPLLLLPSAPNPWKRWCGERITSSLSPATIPAQILEQIQSTPKQDTVPDQWESQILARILSKHQVVLVSECDPELVKAMKMHPAADLSQALTLADKLLDRSGTITAIPEGISTIII